MSRRIRAAVALVVVIACAASTATMLPGQESPVRQAADAAVPATALPASVSSADQWPAWRGATGLGLSDQKNPPTHWSAKENVKWKAPLPGPGNSTPIVYGDRIFLTGALEDGARRTLMCISRSDGKMLWQRELTCDAKELTHDTNPYCASSPVTDGERVVVWHGSAGAAAYDLDGRELWRKDLGKFTHIWGYAASPVIDGDRVLLSCGPGVRALVVALDKRSGKELWKRELPKAQSKDEKEYKGSWSTPVMYESGGKKQLLLSLPDELVALDPTNGDELWKCRGLGPLAYTSVIVGRSKDVGDVAVAMSGYFGPALACRIGGPGDVSGTGDVGSKGDVTDTHRLWRHAQQNPQRVGSGIVVGEYIYILNEPGVAWCLELTTGKTAWEKRISTTSWSSMVLVDGKLYINNAKGETLILKPNPKECEIVATNSLDGEITRASLAFASGQVFVRSYKHLYCIEEPKRQR
jgi:outer membrane protein assembly factor BamB